MSKQLNIPNDLANRFREIEVRKQLMKEYGKFEMPYFGVNEDGESVELHIAEDGITLKTYQNNNWVRVNYYGADGYLEGETFEGKWNK